MHLILVIVNTIIYRMSSFKVLPTTYNTVGELNTLTDYFNIVLKNVWVDKIKTSPTKLLIL